MSQRAESPENPVRFTHREKDGGQVMTLYLLKHQRALLLGFMFFVSSSAVPAGTPAEPEVTPVSNSWDPLLYSDIIVRGEIDSVEIVSIKSADLSMDDTLPSYLVRSLLRVSVRTVGVLRGPHAGDRFTFLCTSDLRVASDFYLLGREVVVCAKYHERLRCYFQPSAYGRFWRDGHVWKSPLTERGTRAFEDEQLIDRISSVDLQHTSASAELIIDGTVISSETGEMVGPDGSSAEVVRVLMRIDRVLKGHITEPQITVVAITRGLYAPTWRAEVPKPNRYASGQRWLCFLKKNEAGWYPFAGANGFLRAVGSKYVYDERVEFWHSAKNVEKVVLESSGSR